MSSLNDVLEKPLVREVRNANVSIEFAAARLTETILGNDDSDLAETLKVIAPEIGVSHIAYLRLSPDKSSAQISAYWSRLSLIQDYGRTDTL